MPGVPSCTQLRRRPVPGQGGRQRGRGQRWPVNSLPVTSVLPSMRMPWLAVDRDYEFDGPEGRASLPGLFEGRGQLIVYRAFFEPGVSGWPGHACPGCSLVADQVAHGAHLNARDTTLVFASRAPQPDIARVKARMGWAMPWYTMTDGFGTGFGVGEWHGTNAFIRDGDSVVRTYFINNRGDEAMGSTWSYLDMTALGRQDWEDSPEGYPQTPPYAWWKWHDGYGEAKPSQGRSDPDKDDLDPAGPRPRPTDPRRTARPHERPRRRGASREDPAALGEQGPSSHEHGESHGATSAPLRRHDER